MAKSDPRSATRPDVLLLGGDGGFSGVPTYLKQLCAALQGDARFSIIADRNEGGYDFATGAITLHEIEGMKTGLSLRRFWGAQRALDAEIFERAPDLVWAHARMSLIQLRLLMILRRLRQKPLPRCAVTYHGLPFGPGHRRGIGAVSLLVERAFLALTPPHQLHFLSAAAMTDFKAQMGERALARHRCHVLTNCSHLGPIGPHHHPDSPTLLMIGRAGYQKNHAAAARLFAALPQEYRLILCGAGTEPAAMAPLFEAVQTGLSKRVQFLGPISDVRPLLARSDLFLLPARYEGMPIAALEAFEAGLPLALSDIPGMAEILAVHPMAVTLDPNTPETAAASVVEIIERFRHTPDAGEAIQAAWAAQFSYDRWRVGVQKLVTDFLE